MPPAPPAWGKRQRRTRSWEGRESNRDLFKKKKKKLNPRKPLKPAENATKSGQLGSKSKKLGRILTKLQRLNLIAKSSESPGLAGDLGVLFP